MGGRKGATNLIFRVMAGGLNFKAERTGTGPTGPYRSDIRGAEASHLGSRIKDQGKRTKVQGSRTKDQGSRIKDQVSRIKDQVSRIKDQGPWSRTLDQGPRIMDRVLARMSILEEMRTRY